MISFDFPDLPNEETHDEEASHQCKFFTL